MLNLLTFYSPSCFPALAAYNAGAAYNADAHCEHRYRLNVLERDIERLSKHTHVPVGLEAPQDLSPQQVGSSNLSLLTSS